MAKRTTWCVCFYIQWQPATANSLDTPTRCNVAIQNTLPFRSGQTKACEIFTVPLNCKNNPQLRSKGIGTENTTKQSSGSAEKFQTLPSAMLC